MAGITPTPIACPAPPSTLPPKQHWDEDSAFFGVVSESDLASQQRANPDLRVMIDYLEGRSVAVPTALKRNLPAFSLKNSVLVKKNFCPGTRANYLLVIPADLREEILAACHDDPSFGHLGTACNIGKIKARYY